MRNFIIFAIIAFTLTGCIVTDNPCFYETVCTTKCNYICDRYGYNCVSDYCWDECWDEHVCSH